MRDPISYIEPPTINGYPIRGTLSEYRINRSKPRKRSTIARILGL